MTRPRKLHDRGHGANRFVSVKSDSGRGRRANDLSERFVYAGRDGAGRKSPADGRRRPGRIPPQRPRRLFSALEESRAGIESEPNVACLDSCSSRVIVSGAPSNSAADGERRRFDDVVVGAACDGCPRDAIARAQRISPLPGRSWWNSSSLSGTSSEYSSSSTVVNISLCRGGPRARRSRLHASPSPARPQPTLHAHG